MNRSGSHTQTSQTLRSTSPVLPTTSRCSQALLELSIVLLDSARAFSGAPESTWSFGGAFRMLPDLTYRIVKFWSCWDLGARLLGTSRAAETAAQLCARLCAVFSQQWCWGFNNHKAFCLSYSSLLQSQDLLHHHMACIIYVSLHIYIQSIWLQMVVKHDRRSTWRHPLRELREAPLGGRCGGMTEQEGREWEDMILPSREDPWNPGKSEWA